MKTYILILTVIFLSSVGFADERCETSSQEEMIEQQLDINTDVPAFLKGAMICVKLVDGKETCSPAEKFKVVPRKQQYIVQKTRQKDITSCQTTVEAKQRKHRVSLLAGQGPKGTLDVDRTSTKVTIESQRGVIGGAQYQYLFRPRWSVGVQLQTNDTGAASLGWDF